MKFIDLCCKMEDMSPEERREFIKNGMTDEEKAVFTQFMQSIITEEK